MPLRDIRIARYADPDGEHPTPGAHWAGYIEGVTEHGGSWIMFLDRDGIPTVYWPHRDPETGAVVGQPILLQPATNPDGSDAGIPAGPGFYQDGDFYSPGR